MSETKIEERLWEAAEELRANSDLRLSEFETPVMGLIFLKFAEAKFLQLKEELEQEATGRRKISKYDYQSKDAVYLPETAQFSYLLNLPEEEDLGKAVNEAMKTVETENPKLKDTLPKDYKKLDRKNLTALLRNFNQIDPDELEGDSFGKIYEFFLGKFALAEGQNGGEFFTPTSLVKLIVEIIEPFHGRILDPASGSCGMFVQSAQFVSNHHKNPQAEIMVYGQEKERNSVKIGKMNLAIHGLEGDIRQGNTFYEDRHNSVGKFDYVMANPPFAVGGLDAERMKDDKRFPFGIPLTEKGGIRKDSGNSYLWIQMFYSALNDNNDKDAPGGRAGFVMASSAADASAKPETKIRKKLIKEGAVDVMVSVGPKFFYSVQLPCHLWFLDKRKKGTDREKQVLFIDARNIFRKVSSSHHDFAPEQIELLANIVNLYRGEKTENGDGSKSLMDKYFPEKKYINIPGVCQVANIDEIEKQGWSLNPGRYVEPEEKAIGGIGDFTESLNQQKSALSDLFQKSQALQEGIHNNLNEILKQEDK